MISVARRRFLRGLAAAIAWPRVARAQVMPVIGLLAATDDSPALPGFRQGLARGGYEDGKNLLIDHRSADGRYERLPALAADLVKRAVSLIAATAPAAALAAQGATTKVPIVFALGSDPVKDGLVASFNRPGGNITGITFFANLLSAKRLELLHQIVPSATVFGLLSNPTNAAFAQETAETEAAAKTLGLRLIAERASTEAEIDTAFTRFSEQGAAAAFISGDAFFLSRRAQIAALGMRYKLPTSHVTREFAEAGGLMTYGADRTDIYQQFGIYAARILKGEKPSDLPVQQPTKFELVINIKTAKALGIEVPNNLLLIADKQIE